MMFKKLFKAALVIGSSVFWICAAGAQTPNITGNEFQTQQAGKTAVGTVNMTINGSNQAVPVNGSTPLPVQVIGGGGGGGGLSVTDQAAWTAGTSQFTPGGGFYNSSQQTLTSGQQGTFALSPYRSLFVDTPTTNSNLYTLLAAIPTAISANAVTVPLGVYQAGGSVYSAVGGTGNALLTGTAIAASASAHTLTGYSFDNTGNNASTYIQFFDVAAGSVTLGTTVPKFVVAVPAGGYVDDPQMSGVTFSTAVTVAATTTRTGSTPPASGVAATVFYK